MIVWISSYPRSGNTFFRVALKQVFGIRSLEKYSIDPTQSAAPNKTPHSPLDVSYHPGMDLETLGNDAETHFVKTHAAREEDDFPAIYLLRDGRDSLVSYAHYVLSHSTETPPPAFEKVLHDLILEKRSAFGTWADNAAYWTSRPNTVTIRFEDLITHPRGALIEAMNALPVETPPVLEEEVSTFEELRDLKPQLFRRGKTNSWRDEFPENLLKLFYKEQGEVHEKLGYHRDP